MKILVEDIIQTWGALMISGAALGVSLYSLSKSRNSISINSGYDQDGEFLCITNNSPHAVTVTDMGAIRADGTLSSFLREDGLYQRIDPRDVKYRYLPMDRTSSRRSRRMGAYVQLATGHRYCTANALTRRVWWVRSPFERRP